MAEKRALRADTAARDRQGILEGRIPEHPPGRRFPRPLPFRTAPAQCGTMSSLRPRFWETVPLKRMSPAEWEALCDGCGKCCLNKLEYEDTGEIAYTSVACRLLDTRTGRCTDYPNRTRRVPECMVLTPRSLEDAVRWLPETCAYKRLWQGRTLPEWHPLITGDPDSTRKSGNSVAGRAVSETDIPEEAWEYHIIEEAI